MLVCNQGHYPAANILWNNQEQLHFVIIAFPMKWDSFASQPCLYMLFCVLSSMAERPVGAISMDTPCRGTSRLWPGLKVTILQPWVVKFLQLWWLLGLFMYWLGRAEPLKLASTKATMCCMGNYPLSLADCVQSCFDLPPLLSLSGSLVETCVLVVLPPSLQQVLGMCPQETGGWFECLPHGREWNLFLPHSLPSEKRVRSASPFLCPEPAYVNHQWKVS